MKPPTKRKVIAPDGSVHMIRVPQGLRRAVLQPGFVDDVFSEVRPVLLSSKGDLYMGVLSTDRGFLGTINWKVLNGVVYWGVRQADDYLACGTFTSRKPAWVEAMAAAKPSVRGKGLYAQVLKILRRDLDRPLLSDVALSDANVVAWSRVGVPDDKKGRFKINPMGPGAASVLRSWVALEIP